MPSMVPIWLPLRLTELTLYDPEVRVVPFVKLAEVPPPGSETGVIFLDELKAPVVPEIIAPPLVVIALVGSPLGPTNASPYTAAPPLKFIAPFVVAFVPTDTFDPWTPSYAPFDES